MWTGPKKKMFKSMSIFEIESQFLLIRIFSQFSNFIFICLQAELTLKVKKYFMCAPLLTHTFLHVSII